jgi:hypothetical protein
MRDGARGLTTLEMSRECAELGSTATEESRAMRSAIRPWGKSQARDSGDVARRCGAGFQMKSTTIARRAARTKLARGLFDGGNSALDRGAGRSRPTAAC